MKAASARLSLSATTTLRSPPIQEEEGEQSPSDRNHTAQLPLDSTLRERKELSEEQLATLKQCFEKYSSTKTVKKPNRSKLNAYGVRQIMTSEPEVDVTISEKQLGQLFVDASMPLHKQTLSNLFAQLSKNKKGKGVSFEDLLQLIREPVGSQQSSSEYQQLFQIYDRKNKGYFDYEDYKFVCEGIAKDLSEGQIREAFDCIDRNRCNRITLSEFEAIMRAQ